MVVRTLQARRLSSRGQRIHFEHSRIALIALSETTSLLLGPLKVGRKRHQFRPPGGRAIPLSRVAFPTYRDTPANPHRENTVVATIELNGQEFNRRLSPESPVPG